jgi:hypothetical protein
MTDKFKDQDSMLPAATDDKKKAIVAKTGGKTQVVINPPEKVDPQRGYQERFKHALEKHSVIIEKKTELVLQSKAARADFPQETLEQVFKRGYKTLPLNSQLTREQYAMNRVNSFVAGGAAMVEDYDLLPIVERAGRPHIQREKSPYNGKTIFHVVDAKGLIKHSTGDEYKAKQHLSTKYNAYMESTVSPMKRFEGTKSLVKTYKDDTPGEKTVKEAKDPSEYDKEGEMAKGQLRTIIANAQRAHDMLKDDTNMAEWVQSKITLASDYISTVADYIQSELKEGKTTKLKGNQGRLDKNGNRRLDKEDFKLLRQEEVKKGLYYYINRRKKLGISRDKDNPKAPKPQDWVNAAKTAKEEVDLSELNKDTLHSYFNKADKQIDAKHKVLGPQIKAGDTKAADKTSAIIGKRMTGMDRAETRLNKEEVSLSELSNAVLARYKAKAGEQASAADRAGDFKKGNKRFSGIMKATRKQFDNDVRKEEKVVSGGYRDKTGKMHPPVTGSGIAKSNADKQKQIADILKAHRERK